MGYDWSNYGTSDRRGSMDFDWIGQAADNIVGFFGQQESQDFSNQTREQTENFQRQMRATQYQTAVSDMSKAGLNPMLAYSQGGSGNLSGAGGGGSPQMPSTNYGQAMATASQVQVNKAQADLLRSQTGKTDAERQEVIARTPTYASSIAHTQSSASQIEQAVKYFSEVYNYRREGEKLDYRSKGFKVAEDEARYPFAKERARLEVEQRGADVGLTKAEVRDILAQAALRELDEPGARARAKRDSSFYGQNVRPYLEDGLKVVNSAGGAVLGGKALAALRALGRVPKVGGPRRAGGFSRNNPRWNEENIE